jgi:L-rhamnose mutarotase
MVIGLQAEKIDEYKKLHAAVWPEVLKTIVDCNLKNYSISIMGDMVVAYFEYTGEDYEADMRKMAADPVTQEWWKHTKPCFVRHSEGVYYEDLEEIFYQP